MASSQSDDSVFLGSHLFGIDSNARDGSDALDLLNQGLDLFIIIGMKKLFDNVVSRLDLPAPPIFVVDDCGEAGVTVSIKIHVRNLPSASGDMYWLSIVEGETMSSVGAAECSAIKKAFEVLEKNHLIRIVDFSSKIADTLHRNDTDEMLPQAIVALHNVLIQWELSVRKCNKVIAQLEENASIGYIFGTRTPSGLVYGILSDYLSDVVSKLHGRTNEAKNGLSQSQAQLALHHSTLHQRSNDLTSNAHFHDVSVSLKFILHYVMEFFGLEPPNYVCSPQPHGFVKSKVTINFPYLENMNIGGSIELEGQAYNYVESREEASYQALLFIEENFRTKVIDYNYSKRKKACQEQSTLFTNLHNLLRLGDSVKMMFGELITTIEGQCLQYSFDPSLFFTGPMSTDQIDAFHFCNNIIHDLDKYSVSRYAACAPHFDVLKRLTWKLLVVKTNAPI